MRLQADTDSKLARLAEKEKLSISALANRALLRYVEFDALAEKFGLMATPYSMMAKVMGSLSDEQLKEIGKWVGENVSKEFVHFWFKKNGFKSLIASLEFLAAYGRQFQFEKSIEGDSDQVSLILKHQIGRGWSVLLQEMLKARLTGLIVERQIMGFELDYTEYSVTVDIWLTPKGRDILQKDKVRVKI